MSQQLLQVWSASTAQISATTDDSTVILNLSSGRYFSLEGVGSKVWEALQQPQSFEDLLATVLQVYEVERAMLESDLNILLGNLEGAGLVTRS